MTIELGQIRSYANAAILLGHFSILQYLFAGTTEVLFFILRPASAAHCSIWGTYSVARGSELQSQEDNPTDVSYERFELG